MPKIKQTGDSHGVVIPVATHAQANLAAGESVIMAHLQDGILIAQETSASGRMVAAMLDNMDRYAETCRTLASEGPNT